MPRAERSAGFVIYRNAPDSRGGRLYLLLNYGRHWDFAKGHVEQGEDDLAAAVRELREETGLAKPRLVDGFSQLIEYYFRSSKHGLVRKHVLFFIGETAESRIILSEEHVGSDFLPYDEAMDRLTYENARDVLAKAHAFLDRTA